MPVKNIPCENSNPPSEEEAEARLRAEGYRSYRWTDVPGTNYPRHRHFHDECIWVLSGEIIFNVEENEFHLKPGDRLYLPKKTPHTAKVPNKKLVTYLVGQKE